MEGPLSVATIDTIVVEEVTSQEETPDPKAADSQKVKFVPGLKGNGGRSRETLVLKVARGSLVLSAAEPLRQELP